MASSPLDIATQLLAAATGGELVRARELEDELAGVDPHAIEGDDARLAFWINLYNARVLSELLERPREGSLLRHRRMFREVGYEVGRDPYSLNDMEHGVLRLNARPPYAVRRVFGHGDERQDASPSRLDPRIHFALNCAAASCPPIHAYEPGAVDEQLDLATRAYLRAETSIDHESGHLRLPYLMKLYRADFGDRHSGGPLKFVTKYLEDGDRAFIESEAWEGRVSYSRDYDWTISA
jgi:hypothetical protein